MDWLRWNRTRYDAYAPVYDLFVRRLGFMERGRRRALEMAQLRAGERVLIVAAGTGLDLPHIPHGVEVTAIDISRAMLARLVARGAGRVAAAQMDAARLGFRHSSFDCVLLHLAIAVVPDPVGTMHEVARVLRPGGRVSVFDKFLPDEGTVSLTRRAAGALARLVATDLNRQLGPLLRESRLTLREREAVGMGGLFVAARADKAAASGESRFAR